MFPSPSLRVQRWELLTHRTSATCLTKWSMRIGIAEAFPIRLRTLAASLLLSRWGMQTKLPSKKITGPLTITRGHLLTMCWRLCSAACMVFRLALGYGFFIGWYASQSKGRTMKIIKSQLDREAYIQAMRSEEHTSELQ